MRAKWLVFASLIVLTPCLCPAQQAKTPNAVGFNRDNTQVVSVSHGLIAPLPLISISEQGPQLSGDQAFAPGMTLTELEEMAVRCNPSLAQAAARVQAARGVHLQVGLYPNPVLGYLAGEINDEKRAGQQGGFVGQEIVTAGKLRLNRDVAGQEIRQAEFNWQAQRFRVLTDVRHGYYDAMVADCTVELTEQLVRIGEQGIKAAEELMKAKEVARVDVLQSRIEADSAKILLDKARNRYTAAWRNLATVVGNPALPPTRLAGNLLDEIIPLTWEDTLNRLLAESPQLACAQAGVARAQAVLDRECAGRIPNIDLQTSVQYDNATQDTIAGVQVGVPIPFFNRNQGNIRKAQAELTTAQQEVKRVRLALEQRLATVFEQYSTARQQVEKYNRDVIPNAVESLKLVSAGYKQGEFNYLALLIAQRTYFQTNLAYLDALRDLRKSAAALEGNLLSDSLQADESAEQGPRQR